MEMSAQTLLDEPTRIAEPASSREFSDALTQVATDGKPVIVCRNGADLAVVIPLEHLDLVREALARGELDDLAAQIDWEQARIKLHPPQAWLEGDEPKPF
jgi:prevent-host-death family protein